MKQILTAMAAICMLFMMNSCGTIYGAAVDERNVSTIADDHGIKGGILKKFSDDPLVGILDFSVSSYKGHVYLIGEYETQKQKDRAITLAKSQKGVNGLTTYLVKENSASPCGSAKNLELTAKVTAKLVGDKDIWSTNIDVKTIQCVTVLWGLVGSKAEIQKAVAHAQSVEGVSKVRSFLKSAK